MILSTAATSQTPTIASERPTTDRETHRSARNDSTHAQLKRLTTHLLTIDRSFVASLIHPVAVLSRRYGLDQPVMQNSDPSLGGD